MSTRALSGTIGLLLSALAVLGAEVACGAERIPVFVSVVPQRYFAEKIGGEFVEVSVMLKPGAGPATYEPKPALMLALSRAKVYFAIGVPFEKVWLNRIVAANREMLVVQTDEGIEKMAMKAHRHGREEPEGSDHRIKDPHIWLSPPMVMLQARHILRALQTIDPVHRSAYEANYKKFIMELVGLDEEIRGIFAGHGDPTLFMVFHPAWGYFARAYGLEQIPVEMEGKEPKPAQLKELIRHAKRRAIKVIFVQPQFSTKSAKTIARAIGGQVAFADPLAPDWANNLRRVALKFKAALK